MSPSTRARKGRSLGARLVEAARAQLRRAHAPYSRFRVGAALETRGGRIFAGCNVENASLGLAICAERVAACSAVAAGEKEFVRIAIVTSAGRATAPCGACRQFLAEFAPRLEVLMVGRGGVKRAGLQALLPSAFAKRDLP